MVVKERYGIIRCMKIAVEKEISCANFSRLRTLMYSTVEAKQFEFRTSANRPSDRTSVENLDGPQFNEQARFLRACEQSSQGQVRNRSNVHAAEACVRRCVRVCMFSYVNVRVLARAFECACVRAFACARANV